MEAIYYRDMNKRPFQAMIEEILTRATGLALEIRNFRGWEPWYGVGEPDDGERTVYCCVMESDETGRNFLMRNGFEKK